jgi:hypothetical protein
MAAEAARDELVEYLVGDLSDDRRQEIESRYFADDELYDALVAVEHELAYDYAAGTLTPDERRRFEQRFLHTAEQRDRVRTARAVLEAIRRGPDRRAVVSPWWLTAAAAVLVAVAGWWVIDRTTPTGTPERAIADRPAPPSPPTGQAPARRTFVVATTLSAGLVRSAGDTPRVAVPPGTEFVQVRLNVPAAAGVYAGYRLVVRDADGVTVGGPAAIDARAVTAGQPVTVDLPAEPLTPGDYELVLVGVGPNDGTTDLAEYYLTILRPPAP